MGADAAVAPYAIDVSIASDTVWRVQSRLSHLALVPNHSPSMRGLSTNAGIPPFEGNPAHQPAWETTPPGDYGDSENATPGTIRQPQVSVGSHSAALLSGAGSIPSSCRTWANFVGSANRLFSIICRKAAIPAVVKKSRGSLDD